ncbi:Anaphase-promoting complex subunit 1 [Cichlidogyrus casuarinus]|uniref:Anaphase-promoting complex subunit 1 n=1 Tax=Cichlidogyrus casuarinus TaxID=1844966 RepID=A0ABD2Q7F1_9PLAT
MQVGERLSSRATGGQRPHSYVKTINVDVQLQEGAQQVNRDLSGLGGNNVPQTASSIQHQISLDQSRPLPLHLRAHMTTDVFSTLGRDNRYKKTQPTSSATWDDSISQRDISQDCLLPYFVPISNRLLRIAGNLLRGDLTAYDLPLMKGFDSDRCPQDNVAGTTTPMWLIEPSSSALGLGVDYSSSRQQAENSLLTESQDILPGNLSRLRHFNGESKKLHPRLKKIADSANIYSGRNFIPDVNGLGSLAAIALVYMGVGSNHPIVSAIDPPQRLRALEEIRPDLLCLRQIALGLVKWHEFETVFDPVAWLDTPMTVVSDYVDLVQQKYNRLLNLYTQQNNKTSRLLKANQVTRLIEHSAPNSLYNIFIDCEMVATAHLTTLMSRAFVLGLRYAGTENEQVVAGLRKLVDSLRNDTWWPAPQSNTRFPLRTKPSFKLLNDVIVTCILALSFVLAGSCDVETLKLIKEVETLKLFNDPKLMAESLKRMQVPYSNDSLILRTQNLDQANQNLVQNCFQKYAMAHYSALFSSARIALRDDIPVQLQQPTVSAALPGTPQMPFISLTGVMGTLLDPLTYGHYQILSAATGLLNLAAGKMTLCNSLEAAAALFIAFFPKFANSACDNVYHLQAFRHLYVLAMRPRKLCAVDVDTNQVIPANFHISLKNGQKYQSEPCLLLNNGISIENIDEITLNFNSNDYWPRVFTCSDPHFDWFRTSFEQFGYMFVKRQKNDNLVDQILQMAQSLFSSSSGVSNQIELRSLLRFLENFLQRSSDEKVVSHLKTIICRLKSSVMVMDYRNKPQR